jgi:tetratricopeptide (TPR) repeat protein
MNVPFHLRFLPGKEGTVAALLLPSHQAEELLRTMESIGEDSLPAVFLTAAGFLLKLRSGQNVSLPGTLRLQALCDDFFLPVHAELIPYLHEDEARALVKNQGLVFLPDGRVLGFDTGRALSIAALLEPAPVVRNQWTPLPSPANLADELREIILIQPEQSPEEVLEPGGQGIGVEDPPESSGLPARTLGKAYLTLGKGLGWLGHTLAIDTFAKMGAGLVKKAVDLAPKLTESLMDRQEAALRALLREFKKGNIERALRRALPINKNLGRGARPSGSARLPWHTARYSLRNLLSRFAGPAGLWLTSPNVVQDLIMEYQRLARLAASQGDYRRAAYIYAKLLDDFRSAANALLEGRLYKDAATIFLVKLADPLAAARAYAAGGLFDEALKLYWKHGQHEMAGDLLRQMGDLDRAQVEYRRAAEKMVAQGRGYDEAGEMLLTRARCPELALDYFKTGWQKRPYHGCVTCAVRLAELYAQEESPGKIEWLLAEAEPYFREQGSDSEAALFFNEVARAATLPAFMSMREDLHDRALCGIAARLRAQASRGSLAGRRAALMFQKTEVWAPPVVSDADFALRRSARTEKPTRRSPEIRKTITKLQSMVSHVTAVCQAQESGEIFVGFELGEIYCFDPKSGKATLVDSKPLQITAIAASVDGDSLLVVRSDQTSNRAVSSYTRANGKWSLSAKHEIISEEFPSATFTDRDNLRVLVSAGNALNLFSFPELVELWNWKVAPGQSSPAAIISFLRYQDIFGPSGIRSFEIPRIQHRLSEQINRPKEEQLEFPVDEKSIGWWPGSSLEDSLPIPQINIYAPGNILVVAGIGAGGTANLTKLRVENGRPVDSLTRSLPGPYRAVALVRDSFLVCVSASAIEYYHAVGTSLELKTVQVMELPGPVAAIPSYASDELVIVCADGTLVRVPML